MTLHAMTESMAEAILADNEKHIKHSLPATADWVLDQILAKEAKGIDCTLERRAAKQYFHKPEFTPLPAASFPALALPRVTDSGSDLAKRIEKTPPGSVVQPVAFNAKAPDGSLIPPGTPEAKKGAPKAPLPGSGYYVEEKDWQDVPF